MHHTDPAMPPAAPWWKFGHVWLIIAGPLVVIVAGFVTLWLAIRTPDPVITPDQYRQGMELNRTLPADPSSVAPAMQARNHAQTGVPVAPPAAATPPRQP
ncbi:MAG: FixH family protein [Curvibacter sp.]